MENMELNRSFWSGKPVFMTGHTGFKGGWISLWLQHMGVSLYGYALEPSERPCLYYEANVGDGMQSFLADVRDGAKLQSAMGKAKPEIAFHFAAQPLVRESYRNPADTYATNVMGTVNFLEAVRRTPSVRVAIVVTSDKCYENREWQRGYREGDAMGGVTPIPAVKVARNWWLPPTGVLSLMTAGWPWPPCGPGMSLAVVIGPKTGSYLTWCGPFPQGRH